MELEPDLSCVLAFCNEVRGKLNRQPVDKLRKGVRGAGSACPIASTINHRAQVRVSVFPSFGVRVYAGSRGTRIVTDTPKCARDFIFAFDGGHLPEFEGEGWYE